MKTMTMTERFANHLAKKIAAKLFTNGVGERAKRLVLTDENALGGWCEAAMANQVESLLNKATQ